jgi:hypothetical protein
MRYLPLAFVLMSASAMAQQAPDPNMQSAGQEIMECVAAKVQLRAQVLEAKAHEAAALAKQKQDDQKAQDEAVAAAVKAATPPLSSPETK